ncbi:hypothetical protein CDD82_2107 [Ophiocordyceps australis]|uniref:Major facilitator superfamily (MFS) profile domain-containing protein n=1 Tax=Ophiocordyceps australis TaxID=1399860 RepID=A0A2C5ZJG1_9HYPO|nr:hypothetical protein CDD82_2107 [Ophiocordyceps australis]
MGLGILEPAPGQKCPGTSRYYDDPNHAQKATSLDSSLKCDTSGSVPIILTPQPSDDPNDPLNWPLWKRDMITSILCFAAVLATSLGSILVSNTFVIMHQFETTITKTATLTGYFFLGTGCAAVFFVPSGRVWGRRHLFLLGALIVIASSVWAGSTRSSYLSFAFARAFQGIGATPFETLVNAAVGDLYCVHQRGLRMALSNLAVFGSAFFTPIVTGKITETLGWQWTFYLVAIFTATIFPAIFLLCPETAYRRDPALYTDRIFDHVRTSYPASIKVTSAGVESAPSASSTPITLHSTLQHIGNAETPNKTFAQNLSLFDGRKTDERYWVLLLRPFPLLLNPAFIWGCLIQGAMIGWTVFIGVIIAFVFVGPPFFWGETKAGYTYTGAFIGAICGFALSGALADSSVRFLTKRNKGIFEPEFRILLVFPMLITGCIGLYGFGLTANDLAAGKTSYVVPLVFFGFEVAGMVIGTVASSLYIIDAYREYVVESLSLMIIFKNILSFVLTWYAYEWLIHGGLRKVMVIIASVQVGVCLLSIPMYVYGKRIRAFYYRHDPLVMTHLR